jgi:RNA polymerase sigma-70 factor, ECF subfamily
MGEALSRNDQAALQNALHEHVEAAQRAWPELQLPAQAFVRHLAAKVGEGPGWIEALRTMRTADLALACACALGDAVAIQAFEREYFGEVGVILAQRGLGAMRADALQALREKLFVGRADKLPAVAAFDGRGSLRSWLRVVAVRVVLNLASRGPRERPVADVEELEATSLCTGDPALEYIKESYRHEFRAAFRAAVQTLPAQDRNVLRFSLVDGLSIDRIAALYGTHRATAARRLVSAKQRLQDAVREHLMSRLGIDRESLESVLRLVRSRLDVTLEAL